MAHIVHKCSCGTVISSMIVCFSDIESSTTVTENGCKKCKEKLEETNGERTREN
jgi:hypothetical protein